MCQLLGSELRKFEQTALETVILIILYLSSLLRNIVFFSSKLCLMLLRRIIWLFPSKNSLPGVFVPCYVVCLKSTANTQENPISTEKQEAPVSLCLPHIRLQGQMHFKVSLYSEIGCSFSVNHQRQIWEFSASRGTLYMNQSILSLSIPLIIIQVSTNMFFKHILSAFVFLDWRPMVLPPPSFLHITLLLIHWTPFTSNETYLGFMKRNTYSFLSSDAP